MDFLILIINNALVNHPELFHYNEYDGARGEEASSPAQAPSSAQPETSRKFEVLLLSEKGGEVITHLFLRFVGDETSHLFSNGSPLFDFKFKTAVSLDKKGLRDLLYVLPTPPTRFPTKFPSLPLSDTLALRAVIEDLFRRGTSPLRDETQGIPIPTGDGKPTKADGKKPTAGNKFLKKPFVPQSRDAYQTAVPPGGQSANTAEYETPTINPGLSGEAKVQNEKAYEECVNSVLTKFFLGTGAQVDGYTPPVTVGKIRASGELGLGFSVPSTEKDKLEKLEVHGLTIQELAKMPAEFNCLPECMLARFWDLASNALFRKRIQYYKRGLALAGKADEELDGPNKLLAALADIQEVENQEVAVDEIAIEITELNISVTDFLERSAEPSGAEILIAAVSELRHAFNNPQHNSTTALEQLALYKGVKLDSTPIKRFKELFLDYKKELRSYRGPFDFLHGRKFQFEKVALLESKAFGKSTEPWSYLTMPKKKGKGKGKGKGKATEKNKVDDVSAEGSMNKKDAGKESDPVTEDPANDSTLKDTPNDATLKDTTIDNGSTKTSAGPAEDPFMVVIDGFRKGTRNTKKNARPPADSKGKGKECGRDGPPLDEVVLREKQIEILLEKEVDLVDPKTGEVAEITAVILHRVSSAFKDKPGVFVDGTTLLVCKKMYDLMEQFIRPQTAEPSQVDLVCLMLRDPDVCHALNPVIDELKWNRSIVEHPNNPMITKILQATAHLRRADGIHPPSDDNHPPSSRISVASMLTPEEPPPPAGPSPATPTINNPTEEEAHLSRADGIDHPSRISVGSLLTPEDPPPPAGPSPATPAINNPTEGEAHLRRADGVDRRPPLFTPQYPPLPAGPSRDMAATIDPTESHSNKERPSLRGKIPLKYGRENGKSPFEDEINSLNLKLENVRTEMNAARPKAGDPITGVNQHWGELLDEFTVIGRRIDFLAEKARVDEAGGKIADDLAHKLKKLAEDDGSATIDIP